MASPSESLRFVCPLNQKEMNGGQPFLCVHPCGCVFSQCGLRSVLCPASSSRETSRNKKSDGGSADREQLDVFPQCATKFCQISDVLMINPAEEVQQRVHAAMERGRSREPVKSESKKRKIGTDSAIDETNAVSIKKKLTPARQSPAPTPGLNPTISTASRALTESRKPSARPV